MQLTRTLSVLAVVISLAACGGASGTQEYRIATASVRGDAINLARLDGVLEGSINVDRTACFWVSDGSVRTALFWPYG